MVSYGRLMYNRNGRGDFRTVGAEIEAMAVDSDGTAYMALNRDLSRSGLPTLKAPVLLKYNLNNATAIGRNVVTVVGRIPISPWSSADNISGLAFHPATGALYGLHRTGDTRVPDRLLVISKTNASVIANRGDIRNTASRWACDSCEDFAFDGSGNLYATDDRDDHLYRVSTSNGQIAALSDATERDGTGLRSVKIEGMTWDSKSSEFITFDDYSDTFIGLTLQPGQNRSLGKLPGLTDVEGLAFYTPAQRIAAQTATRSPAGHVDLSATTAAHVLTVESRARNRNTLSASGVDQIVSASGAMKSGDSAAQTPRGASREEVRTARGVAQDAHDEAIGRMLGQQEANRSHVVRAGNKAEPNTAMVLDEEISTWADTLAHLLGDS